MRKITKPIMSVVLTLIMLLALVPTTALAEAGDWDPLTDPNKVQGTLASNTTQRFWESTNLDAGKDGYLRVMPILNSGSYSYNAMAYCGARAKSNQPDIVDVKSIEIGKWQGGAWSGADCLQVTVNPKQAGTAVVTINFYYTYSQSANPITNPNAKWFYGEMKYTVNVEGQSEYTVTYTDGVDDETVFADQSYTVKSGDPTPAFQIEGVPADPSRDGYVFLGWTPEIADTVTGNVTYTAQWEEKLTDVTLKSSIREGSLLFLNDEFTVTVTANTAADIDLNAVAMKGEPFEQVGEKQVSEDGKTATFTYRVKQITAAYTKLTFTATATKGTQEPVTGSLSLGVNLRNRIHVTLKRMMDNSVIDNATVVLNHPYPQWNKCPKLTFKNGEYRANDWDISNQPFSSVTIQLNGQEYSISKDVKGRDLSTLFSAGTEEVYVEYVVVDPINVEIIVDGVSVGQQAYQGTAGETLNYSQQLNSAIQNIITGGRTILSLTTEGLTDGTATFGHCTNVKVSITTAVN